MDFCSNSFWGKNLKTKEKKLVLDGWMAVVWSSMWRLLLLCGCMEILLVAIMRPPEGYTYVGYLRTFLLVPLLVQTVVVLILRPLVTKLYKQAENRWVMLLSLLLVNVFVGSIAAVYTSVSLIPVMLVLPVVMISAYKKQWLIRVQIALTVGCYIIDRLVFLPRVVYRLKTTALVDIIVFLTLMLAFAAIEEQVRKSSLQQDIQIWKDSLTNLYNHEAFYEELEFRMKNFEENHEVFSIMIADIDNFKKVNDTYGHAYGDEVIRMIAQIMEQNKGSKGFVARYGGEEFAMIFPKKAIQEAVLAADNIRREFASRTLESKDGPKSFTISIGVAEYDHTYRTASAFFEEADQALYKAKATGKNKVCCNTK